METQHTHWKRLVNPAYIGAYCIESDTTARITKVTRELVKGEGGKSEECTVAHLDGMKPFILNRTNCKTITKLYGSPYIEDWVGKLIVIYPTVTKVAGETVECLRIRPTRPEPSTMKSQPKPVNPDLVAALKSATTLDQLRDVYAGLSKADQVALVAVKDECKRLLTEVRV